MRQAVEVCESYDHPVATTLKSGLLRYGKSSEEIEKAMESVALHEVSKLERGLWVLLTGANIAPLFGFLGTVIGMVLAFDALSEQGWGTPRPWARASAYNYFNSRQALPWIWKRRRRWGGFPGLDGASVMDSGRNQCCAGCRGPSRNGLTGGYLLAKPDE